MTRRVLFVDDEPQILEGLRHRLHRQRKVWEMHFAQSGREGLEILAREPMGVIVTDMRMPQMDGATLLKRVQELHPHVVRIVLSGHAELETALRAVPVAHQFLSKPSEPGVIESVVERACKLQLLVNDEVVKQTVGRIERLPSLPRVYSQLMSVLSKDNASSDDVARILSQDMAICAKVLQIVNSAFFRLPRTIGKIEEAVRYLGLTTIKHVTLAVELFQQGQGQGRCPEGFSLDALQKHSLRVTETASHCFSDKQGQEDAFAVGLLHDIGKLLIASELPQHMEKVLQEMKASKCSMNVAEETVWGVAHAEVGGYLLGLWGLPYPLIEVVANHHEPSRVETLEYGVLAAVHIADALVHEIETAGHNRTEAHDATEWWSADHSSASCAGLDTELVTRLKLTDKVEMCREQLRQNIQKQEAGLG